MNALATDFAVDVYRDGIHKRCEFAYGHFVKETDSKCSKDKTGTIIEFVPDEEILGKAKYNHKDVLYLCKTLSYLCDVKIKVTITLKNGEVITEKFKSKNGILDLINEMVVDKIVKPIYISHEEGDKRVEVAFTYATELSKDWADYTDNDGSHIISFVNFCTTTDGGSHVTGFKQGLSNALIKYTKESMNKREAGKLDILPNDIREGLVAVVNAGHMDGSFVGQVKNKNNNEDLVPFVRYAVQNGLRKFLKDNEKDGKKIADWVKTMAKIRMKASEARKNIVKKDFNNAFSKNRPRGWYPANNDKDLEVFIVEGKSAAGSASQSRDKNYQELIELRGVPKGTLNKSFSEVLKNEEMKTIVTCSGAFTSGKFDINKCRYKKFIIMTDSDIDGYKITSILASFFMEHMRDAVEAGMIYKVVPPLYKIIIKGKIIYIKDNKDYARFLNDYISDSIDLYKISNNDKFKVVKKEVAELIVRTKTYARNIKRLSKSRMANPVLLEYLACNYNLLEDKKYNKLNKVIKKKFHFMDIIEDEKGFILKGSIDKESHYIRLNDKFINQLKPIYTHIYDYEEGEIYFELNGELHSLYEISMIFKKYEPSNRQRYKGLGEMNPHQLWETTLDPTNRTLIQLTTDNFKRDLEVFNLLHADKSECRAARKEMMRKYKVDIEDIDN